MPIFYFMTIQNNEFINYIEQNGFKRHIPTYSNKWQFFANEGIYDTIDEYRIYLNGAIRITMDGNICYVAKHKKNIFTLFFWMPSAWQEPVTEYLNIPNDVIRFINNKELPVVELPKASRYICNKTKYEVFLRFKSTCNYCGSREKLEIDHIHPYSKGGGSNIENLQLLCKTCNIKKSNKLLNEISDLLDILSPKL
jgi:hypothetical protein